MTTIDPAALRYDAAGLVPVVAQEVATGRVLMLAYANREAVELTLVTGFAHFFSRSRRSLWKKGETSGHVLEVVEIRADCDGDAVLLRVHPAGPACHRGTPTCFADSGEDSAALELGWLARVIAERAAANDAASYTAKLLSSGLARVAQKVGEEGVEVALAAVTNRDSVADEAADLLYHMLVLLHASGVEPARVARALAERHRAKARALKHGEKGSEE